MVILEYILVCSTLWPNEENILYPIFVKKWGGFFIIVT